MSKPKLSKGVLEMKFMQRTKAKVEQEKEANEGRSIYANEITDRMTHGSSRYLMEPSFFLCENLIDGRLSYRGMNPEIERIMELEEGKSSAVQSEMLKEVSDTEMCNYYENVSETIKKKFSKNNLKKPPNKKIKRISHGKGRVQNKRKNQKNLNK